MSIEHIVRIADHMVNSDWMRKRKFTIGDTFSVERDYIEDGTRIFGLRRHTTNECLYAAAGFFTLVVTEKNVRGESSMDRKRAIGLIADLVHAEVEMTKQVNSRKNGPSKIVERSERKAIAALFVALTNERPTDEEITEMVTM